MSATNVPLGKAGSAWWPSEPVSFPNLTTIRLPSCHARPSVFCCCDHRGDLIKVIGDSCPIYRFWTWRVRTYLWLLQASFPRFPWTGHTCGYKALGGVYVESRNESPEASLHTDWRYDFIWLVHQDSNKTFSNLSHIGRYPLSCNGKEKLWWHSLVTE